LYTNDPTISDLGVTQYPPLPANTEPSKIEEIRRTVYIGNLEKECDGEALMGFLNATIGEV
jgi:arginine/serine-rich splicing factor 12